MERREHSYTPLDEDTRVMHDRWMLYWHLRQKAEGVHGRQAVQDDPARLDALVADFARDSGLALSERDLDEIKASARRIQHEPGTRGRGKDKSRERPAPSG